MSVLSKQLFADKIIRWGTIATLVFLGVQTIYIGIIYHLLPPLIPLFNQLPWGDSRLGTRLEILLPLILTIVFLCINYFLMSKVHRTMPLVARILSITTLLVSLLAIIFIVRTVQLII